MHNHSHWMPQKIAGQFIALICFVAIALVAPQSHSQPERKQQAVSANFLDFQKTCEKNLAILQSLDQRSKKEKSRLTIRKGETEFARLQDLVLGQDQISRENVLRKKQEREEDGDIENQGTRYRFSYDDDRSIAPKSDPIYVVKSSFGYVIVDGNHEYFLSLYLGAETLPVKVIADFSDLSKFKFWKKMEKRGFIYMRRKARDLSERPPTIADVRDVPERYFASLLHVRVKTQEDEKGKALKKFTTAERRPVWVKLDSGIPFVEFHIAKVLRDAGLFYDPNWGIEIPFAVIEKARAALLKAQRNLPKTHVLQKILILDRGHADAFERAPSNTLRELLGLAKESVEKNSCRLIF